jgi:hypothetical protein
MLNKTTDPFYLNKKKLRRKKMKSVKSLVVVLALMVLLSVNLKAEYGIKAGIEMSKMSNIDEETGVSYKSLLGFRAGLFYGYEFSKGLFIQPEIYFVQKGLKTAADGVYLTVKDIINYIEIPLLLKYRLSEGNLTPSIFVGPFAAFRISAKEKINDASIDTKDLVKSFDYGLTGGFEFAYNMGETSKLLFDLRYNLGLGKVSNIPGDTKPGKNRGFSAMIGVSF